MIALVRGEGPVSSPIVIYVDVNTLLRVQAICSGPRTAVGVSVRAADRPGPLAVEHVPEADAERGEPGDANASPGCDREGDGVVGGSAAGGRSALVCIPARAADTPAPLADEHVPEMDAQELPMRAFRVRMEPSDQENVGGFAAFFCRTFVTSIVIKSDENVVEISGRGAG
ncbi:unnamed protein product, partial [Pylaiella littoralis]